MYNNNKYFKEENMIKEFNKPSDYYKNLRPEYFSDSTVEQEIQLPKEQLAYELSQLSINMKQDLFENLARRLCEKLITPNLIPQTGPTGGGDGKTDSETYPVDSALSDRWFINGKGANSDNNWAFAFSVKTEWKPKIKSDVKNIVGTNRGYNKIYFVSNQKISSKKKKDVQDELKSEYGVEIIILDGEWIIENIYSNNFINIVVDSLNLSQVYKTKNILGSNDKSRTELLSELEENIANTDRYFEYDQQLVSDALDSALLSRMLELPKDEVIGKFLRARRFNKKYKSSKLDIKITYQLAWTYFMYYNDYEDFLEEFNTMKSYFADNSNFDISDVEMYNNLMSLLFGLSAHYNLEEKEINIEEEKNNFISKLEKFKCEDEKYTSSCLLARFFEVHINLMHSIKCKDKAIKCIDEILFILEKSEKLLDFPFKMIKDFTKQLGILFKTSSKLDILFDRIAEIESKRSGEKEGGKVFLERGMQKAESNNHKDALIYFGKSVSKLAKDESKDIMYYSLIGLSISYLELGLNYSYYNSITAALDNKLQDFFHGGKLSKSAISVLKETVINEILLGRIAYILVYLEIYLLLSMHTLDENDESRAKFITMVDGILAIRLLNTDINEVNKYTFLPDLFGEFDLILSQNSALYLFGNTEDIDEEMKSILIKEEGVDEFFNKIKNKQLDRDFIGKTNFQDKENYVINTKILGVNFIIEDYENILLKEQLLAFIEGYFATGISKIHSKVGNIKINFNVGNSAESIEVDKKLNIHTYQVFLNNNTDIGEFYYKITTHIFVNSFLTNNPLEYLEELYKKEEVFERVSIILCHATFIKNLLGSNSKLTINDWKKSNYKEYKILSEPKLKDNKKVPEPKSFEDFTRHDNRGISTIINMDYWDKAEWNSFGAVTQPATGTYGIMIGFESKKFANKIADEWKELFGHEDKNNTIRIHVIKGIDKDNPLHYRVGISSNIDIENKESDFVMNFIRNKTITPYNSNNLDLLENLYKNKKDYYIHIAHTDIQNNNQELVRGFYIRKNELIIKNAYEIKEGDIEMGSIFKGDNPIIPEGLENTDLINKINGLGRQT